MNPYLMLNEQIEGDRRRFVDELSQWHDDMVMLQRVVRRVGQRVACSDTCPHAVGRRLWDEARSLLGTKADALTFLRSCATKSV